MPRIFTALQQAREGAKAVAAGYDGQLRIALSDGITPPRLSAFLAKCRDDDPEVGIHLAEIPLSQQIAGLREDLYDAGFVQSDDVGDGLLAMPAWHDPLVVAVPAKHPLLSRINCGLGELEFCHADSSERPDSREPHRGQQRGKRIRFRKAPAYVEPA
ncbi:hypothetical protein KVP10_10590 [Candidimonas humi]|nr:hypothetical protein [Candidimonas humi]